MIAEIQVLPAPAGPVGDEYGYIDAAIREVAASGLRYEVGALGTTVEGPADDVWRVLRRMHEQSLVAGADTVVAVIKIVERAEGELSIASLVDRYRAT